MMVGKRATDEWRDTFTGTEPYPAGRLPLAVLRWGLPVMPLLAVVLVILLPVSSA